MSIQRRLLTVIGMGLLLLAAAPSYAEVRTFRGPQHQGYRLDYCQAFGQICGERVATQWCRGQGYEYASDWAVDRDIGDRLPTMAIDDDRVCRDKQCDGFTAITCGREGRSFRLPNLGSMTRATVITPDRRGTAPAIMAVEVELLVPGCDQTEPGVLLCGTVHEYQHCRTLFAAGKVLGCRAGLAFEGAFANPIAAADGSYELDLRSRASATVSQGRRGQGRLRGDADFSVSFTPPVNRDLMETCLQRDRYVYYPSGPQGGLAEINETTECGQPIEGSIEPHGDDLLRAYDLCEARSAWGNEIDGSIELLVAGLYHMSARTAADGVSVAASTRIVAPYLTVRAPLSINCRD
jgi:hypothetical protein